MRIVFLIFLIVFYLSGVSQNLVPNFSFEEPDTTRPNCCGVSGYFEHNLTASVGTDCAAFWSDPLQGFSGFFGVVRNCFDFPFNPSGGVFPSPVEGSAYAQWSPFSRLPSGELTDRHLNVELISSLQADATYCTEFFLRLSPVATGITKSPGILFYDSIIPAVISQQFKYMNPSIQPQIFFPNTWVDNLNQWQHLKGSFVANGGEKYLMIGSFFSVSDSAGRIFSRNPSGILSTATFPPNAAIWLIDAVHCYKCSDTLFTVDIGRDTTLCSGDNLSLHAVYDGFKLEDSVVSFEWQTPYGLRTDSTVLANQTGYYEVTVTINQRFTATAGIYVTIGPEPPDSDKLLPETAEICGGRTLNLTLPEWESTSYQWNTGDTTRSITVNNPGFFSVVAENDCWVHEESVQVNLANCENHLWIPDAFTPDGDGLNDVFEIIGSPFPLHLTVFDRWGSVVFDGEDYQNNWNGTYPSGEPVPEGVYTYHVRYYTSEFGGQKSRFGSLQVFRTR